MSGRGRNGCWDGRNHVRGFGRAQFRLVGSHTESDRR